VWEEGAPLPREGRKSHDINFIRHMFACKMNLILTDSLSSPGGPVTRIGGTGMCYGQDPLLNPHF